jgi:hypothetical protein
LGLRLCAYISPCLQAAVAADYIMLLQRALSSLAIGLYLLKLTGWHSTTPAKKHGRPLSTLGLGSKHFSPAAVTATSANWPRAPSDQSQNAPAFHHIFSLQAYAQCFQVDYASGGGICLGKKLSPTHTFLLACGYTPET